MTKLLAGASERIITPKETVPFGEVKWCGNMTGVHDDIYVKSLYFSSGEDFLLVVIDIMILFASYIADLRKKLSSEIPLDESRIMICATQNHSSPASYGGDGWAMPEMTGHLGRWYKFLENQIIESAKEAYRHREEVTISIAKGEAKGIAGNRRPVGKNGRTVMTWHRPVDADISDWKEEDPSVVLIKLNKHDNSPLAIMFSFSCHPNSAWATRKISSDFHGCASGLIKKAYPDTIPVFINGACGDIDPTKYMKTPKEGYNAPIAFEKDAPVDMAFDDIERFGTILADEIIRLDKTAKPVQAGHIKSLTKTVRCKKREGSSENVVSDIEIQAFCIGREIAFIGIPAEPFLKIENLIESAKVFPNTIVVGHANGYSGYIPLKEDYPLGGYGVGVGEAPLEPGSGEKIVEEAIAVLKALV